MMTRHILSGLLVWAFFSEAAAQENVTYQRPPDDIAKLAEAPLTPSVFTSHDHRWMVLLERSDYPSIEELSRPELRIAGLRINPDNFGPSRASYFPGMKVKSLVDRKEHTISNLPENVLISNISFSPDSKKLAFLHNAPNAIELWVIDMTTLVATRLTNRKVNSVFGGSYYWLPDSRRLLFAAVPEAPRQVPVSSRVPAGPVVEENLGKKAPSRTYQDLLKNPHDEALFEFYGASELVLKDLTGAEKVVSASTLHMSFSPSPDGSMILRKTAHRPFSYLVPYYRFPQKVDVVSIAGDVIKEIIDLPLIDNIPNGFNAVQTGPRGHNWRADMPSALYWAEAQDGGDPKVKADIRDKVFQLNAPFSGEATEMIALPLRYNGVTWGNQNIAWITEYWWNDRKERVYQINPATREKKIVFDRSTEDVYNDPGNVITSPNRYGRYVMQITADNKVFLRGNGSSPEGDMPFLDRMDLKTGKKTRLWQCEAPYYEYVVSLLDAKKGTFITSRESQEENPNYFLRKTGDKSLVQLTEFPHPYPHIRDVKKQVLRYKRDDGVDLTADLYLPPGYTKGDGPLPTFFWAYPVEFKSKGSAGQVKGSPHTFTRISSGSPIFWAVRGYAILNNASIPIVGEGDAQPNDTYVQQLVASAKAAIDYGASMGVVDPNRVAAGGHSYGAFMTANLLAHCDLFKAGIARSGAYNRTLTPFGFQAEERTYWEAPNTYFEISPFSYAHKVNEPILLIHGEADNNSGTFPIQSERFYNALKGHGATTRFVLLPYESHGYRARESVLHMLWEMDKWLETYVKHVSVKASASE
jgi:dipeptidyl aminopeptidase/acylaminoacyl peptidase